MLPTFLIILLLLYIEIFVYTTYNRENTRRTLKGILMKVITQIIKDTKYATLFQRPSYFKDCCYIDIETTGFDRQRHSIYLVGLVYCQDSTWYLTQYLCEKKEDEYELLYRINTHIKKFNFLIHYNGNSFDLPFIQARLSFYRIDENLSQCTSIDYYQGIKPFKHLLGIDDLKLKTVERCSGYQRIDPFDGGQLIQVYKAYIQGDLRLEPALLGHNEEDMMGLYALNSFYPFFTFIYSFKELPHITFNSNKESCTMTLALPDNPHHYSLSDHPFVKITSNAISCKLPVYTGTLKYFYDDYKSYYYLPMEDYAIHHSVACYVHASHKKKATKKTAYIKKKDIYIRCPLPPKEITQLYPEQQIPFFYDDVHKHHGYIQIDTFKDLCSMLFVPFVRQLLSP